MGTEILPGKLWMCGLHELNQVLQRENNVIAVVSLCGMSKIGPGLRERLGKLPFWLSFHFHDEERMPNEDLLEAAVSAVEKLLKSGVPTIVHCNAGLNRSGLVLALALQRYGYTPTASVESLRILRGKYVLCNKTFETYVLEGPR